MNQSVLKALKLLDYFIDNTDLSLGELAKQANLPKPTVYRLASSLEASGFLVKEKKSEQDVRYRLGLKLLEFGNVVAERLELRQIALPHMQTLCEEINEVVHLVIRDRYEAVYIEKVESKQAIRLYTRVGRRSPLYVGSGPKLLLAYLPPTETKRIIEQLDFEKFTENTITDPDTLIKQLELIREQGFSVSYGEQDEDTIGFSFPIMDYTGQVIAALSVSGPQMRFVGDREQFIKDKAKKTAKRISQDLGFHKK